MSHTMSRDVLCVDLLCFVLFFQVVQSKLEPLTFIGANLWSLRGLLKLHGACRMPRSADWRVPG